MKRFKKVISLMLAVTLVLSLWGPLASTISAMAASEDDLSDWLVGGGSTVTGNPIDGWQLSLGNGVNYGSEVASYSNGTIDLSKLQVNFDLTDTNGGFMIGLGDTLSGFPAENGNVLNFYFTKNSDSTWSVDTYKGGGSFNKISNLDLTGPHAFGFIKKDSGWALSIDGQQVGKIDTDEDFGSNGAYGDLINSVQAEQARVTFVQFGEPVTIKNISFTFEKRADDVSAWLVGGGSKVTGNPTDGWQLALGNGQNYGSEVASYSNGAINLSKLQVNFDLTDTNGGFMIGLGDTLSGFPANDGNVLNFYFAKNGDNTWTVDTYKGGGSFNKISNLNLTGPHALGFIKVGSGWALAIDEQQVGKVDTEEGFESNGAYGDLINSVQAEQARVTFVQFGDPVTIKNISFVEKEVLETDVTGWSQGETTTMSGNPSDGWKIDFKGLCFEGHGTSYTAKANVSRLQVKFNLSNFPNGKTFILQLANEKGVFDHETANRVNMAFEKNADGSLTFYGLDGGLYNYHRIENFNYTKNHVLEFTLVEDKWVPTLDGEALAGDEAANNKYDSFVKTMIEESKEQTVVSFAPNSVDDTVLTIRNINFVKKAIDQTSKDWVKMSGASVIGDKETGFEITGKEYQTAYYKEPLKAEDTTLHFKLSVADQMWNTLALMEDVGMPLLPDTAEMTIYKGMAFIFERKGTDLGLQIWEGRNIYQIKKIENFDFDATHTLTFKNEHGNWYVVFDGQVIRSRQMNEIAGAMLSAENGVYYRFSACYNDFSFGNIKFENTPQKAWEESNWSVVGYEMSGAGDNLSFKGNGYISWEQEIDLRETSIEAQFKPTDGGWMGFTISDMPTVGDTQMPGMVVPEESFNAISIIMGRQDEKNLRISLFGMTPDGPAEKLIGLVRHFDFDAVHKFRLVEKNGNYYLALDGDVIEWPEHDGEDGYITNAISDLLRKLDNKVYIRFMNDQVMGGEWNHISFVKEEFTSPRVFTSGNVATSVTKKGLSISGAGVVGINSAFDVRKSKLRVQFKPENDNWILLTIGNTPSPIMSTFFGPDNKHNMMCFVLGRQDNDSLRLSMWDGEKELMLVCLHHFNFDAEHTFGFVQHRGKYYLAIDDRMIEAVAMDGENEVVTSWITKAVKKLSESTAYVRFACDDNSHMELSRIYWNGVNFSGVVGSPETGDTFPVVPLIACMFVSAGGILIIGKQVRRNRAGKKR